MIVAYQLSCFDPNNRTNGMIEIAQQEPSENQRGPYVRCS